LANAFDSDTSAEFPWTCKLLSLFVKDFSTITAPLHDSKKGVSFHWGQPQEDSFALLKENLTHAPLLQLPNFG
jgi:hypothetical protein